MGKPKECDFDCDDCKCTHILKCGVCWKILCSRTEDGCKIEGYYCVNRPICKDCYQEVKE